MKESNTPMANWLLLFAMLLVVLGIIIWFLLISTTTNADIVEPRTQPNTTWTTPANESSVPDSSSRLP